MTPLTLQYVSIQFDVVMHKTDIISQPPNLISGIITESGVLLPSAVSEELIKIWF